MRGAVGLTRKDLHAILHRAAERAGAVVTYDVKIVELDDDGRGVTVTLTNGHNCSPWAGPDPQPTDPEPDQHPLGPGRGPVHAFAT